MFWPQNLKKYENFNFILEKKFLNKKVVMLHKINCLVVLGPKSYFLKGVMALKPKKRSKSQFHLGNKILGFGPKSKYCHYFLDPPVSQSLKTYDLKKKSTMFVLPKNTKFVPTKTFIFFIIFFRSLVQIDYTWDLAVKGLNVLDTVYF